MYFRLASDPVFRKGTLLTFSAAMQLATKALNNVKENAV
jgi:hypothetical protein